MRLRRRTFLKKLASASATFGAFLAALATGQLLLSRKKTRSLYPSRKLPSPTGETFGVVRPPAAVPEREFLAGCIRCYRCQDVCDTGCIQFYTEQHGRYFHTPYVDPAKAACNLCMKCTQVCPTEVLKPLEPQDRAKVDMATVTLDADLCLSYKTKRIRRQQRLLMELGRPPTEADEAADRRGICGECYMVCPLRERAITYEPGGFLTPIISQEDCVGCGLCEEICRLVLRGEPAIRVVPTRMAI